MMKQWLLDNGAAISSKFSDSDGKLTCEDTNMNVLVIPQKCVIKGSSETSTCYTLLQELCNPLSFFKPYLDTLPPMSHYENSIFNNINPEDIKNVKELNDKVGFYISRMLTMYEILKVISQNLSQTLNYEKLIRYTIHLYFSFNISNMMIPYINKCEKRLSGTTSIYIDLNNANDTLSIRTRDKELYICCDNSEYTWFKTTYNLEMPNAPVNLYFETNKNSFVVKQIKEHDLKEYFTVTDKGITEESLRLARILCSTPSDFGHGLTIISYENENKAIRFLIKILTDSKYSTSEKFKIISEHNLKINSFIDLAIKQLKELWMSYIQ